MDSGSLAARVPLADSGSEMALQLQAAQFALAQTQRGQSEFLGAMGHALREPLTAILGFAQLMDAGAPTPTPRQKSNLAQIQQAGWGLLALIDDIVDASLIACGKLQLQMEDVELEEVLRDCEILVEPLARQSDVQVVFAWPAQPLIVVADRARLRQILMSLLGHALVHSGAAGTVHVNSHRCADGRARVHFQDTSGGRSAAWLAQVDPVKHIQLIVSQQLAGCMAGVIATESTASTAGNACAYWLELNEAGHAP